MMMSYFVRARQVRRGQKQRQVLLWCLLTEMLVVERVESAPLALGTISFILIAGLAAVSTHVDGHALTLGQTHGSHLGDVLGRLHVCGVASGTKDDGNLGVGVDVVGRDERTGRVVDERGKFGANVLTEISAIGMTEGGNGSAHVFGQRLFEHGSDVVALDVGSAKALGPSDEFCTSQPCLQVPEIMVLTSVVNSVLPVLGSAACSRRSDPASHTHEQGYENYKRQRWPRIKQADTG